MPSQSIANGVPVNKVLVFALPVVVAIGLAGCSQDSASTDEATQVGGMAVCDEAALTTAVKDYLASDPEAGAFQSLDGFECADGWAVTFPTVGPTMDEAYTYTQIFQAEGQFWIPVAPADRGSVCGTFNTDDPTAYPADSEVPESIWQAACNTN